MATSARSGHTTEISWNGNAVAEVTEIKGPKTSVKMKEVTNNDSGGWEELIPTIISSGTFSIKGNFLEGDTDGQIAIQSDHLAKTAREAIITLPAAFGITFSSAVTYCTEFEVITPVKSGDEVSFEATFRISGETTFTTATSTGLTDPFFSVSESGVIVPDAAGDVYTYVVTVITTVESITVTPTAAAGVITINGNVVATGEASSAITLGAAGSVTEATIIVTETSKAPKTYTLYITRASV